MNEKQKQEQIYKKREKERQKLSNLLQCDFCTRYSHWLVHAKNKKKLCGTCHSNHR